MVQLLAEVRAPLTDMAVLPALVSSPIWLTTPGWMSDELLEVAAREFKLANLLARDGSGLRAGLGVHGDGLSSTVTVVVTDPVFNWMLRPCFSATLRTISLPR